MGASLVYLESPNKEKHVQHGQNDKLSYGACEMQGWRLGMEDAVIANLDFDEDTSLFGVFDGHGGKEASQVVKDNYERILKGDSSYKDGDCQKGLYDSFKGTDVFLGSKTGKQEMKAVADSNPEVKNPLLKILGEEAKDKPAGERDEESYMLDSKGCTANVVLIKGSAIYCANAGDSRCVLSREGKAVNLSGDHKPENEIERERIRKAGSEIVDGRVDGNLNLSRSLGDLKHKQKPGLKPEEQPITCVPDITVDKIKPGDDFIVMACDGIWEVKSSQDVVDFISERLKKDMKLTDIIGELFEDIISPDYTATQGLGCDNMSCIIIKLR
uniref:protein-serine/threonine phosphatase n=1 Tax=Euplotes vannus TaxID=5939 RepID=Q6A1M6_EUPVA|nr:protein phosphatase 2C [Euplotes vannus]